MRRLLGMTLGWALVAASTWATADAQPTLDGPLTAPAAATWLSEVYAEEAVRGAESTAYQSFQTAGLASDSLFVTLQPDGQTVTFHYPSDLNETAVDTALQQLVGQIGQYADLRPRQADGTPANLNFGSARPYGVTPPLGAVSLTGATPVRPSGSESDPSLVAKLERAMVNPSLSASERIGQWGLRPSDLALSYDPRVGELAVTLPPSMGDRTEEVRRWLEQLAEQTGQLPVADRIVPPLPPMRFVGTGSLPRPPLPVTTDLIRTGLRQLLANEALGAGQAWTGLGVNPGDAYLKYDGGTGELLVAIPEGNLAQAQPLADAVAAMIQQTSAVGSAGGLMSAFAGRPVTILVEGYGPAEGADLTDAGYLPVVEFASPPSPPAFAGLPPAPIGTPPKPIGYGLMMTQWMSAPAMPAVPWSPLATPPHLRADSAWGAGSVLPSDAAWPTSACGCGVLETSPAVMVSPCGGSLGCGGSFGCGGCGSLGPVHGGLWHHGPWFHRGPISRFWHHHVLTQSDFADPTVGVTEQAAFGTAIARAAQGNDLRATDVMVADALTAPAFDAASAPRMASRTSHGLLRPAVTELSATTRDRERAFGFRSDAAEEAYGRGYQAYWNGQFAEALTWLDAAIEAHEADARFWYYRGLALLAQNQHDAAVTALGQAVRLERQGLPAGPQIGQALDRVQGATRVTLNRVLQTVVTPGS